MASTFQSQGFDSISDYSTDFTSLNYIALLKEVVASGANTVELTPRMFTTSQTSVDVTSVNGRSETDADLIAGIKLAQSMGLSVTLKPQIQGLDGANANSLAPKDVNAFFSNYQKQIIHLAQLAQANDVATFSIGNEMSTLTGSKYTSQWTSLITAVRQVYSGQITYSAATNEASSVSFWDQVDVIGVNMYPILTNSQNPTVQELVSAWNSVSNDSYWARVLNYYSPIDFLKSLSNEYGKQVEITETGYRSITGAASDPGNYKISGIADENAQLVAYQALAQVLATETGSWLRGVQFWQGSVANANPATSYSPIGKAAESIVSALFSGQLPTSGLTITGSTLAGTLDYANSIGNNVIIGGHSSEKVIAGSGNDTIFATPDTLDPLKTTTIKVTGYGDVVNGVGAQMQLMVNGVAVGNVVTFSSATTLYGAQTYTFTFANTDSINSLDFKLLNPGSSRGLHITAIDVNGTSLRPSQAANTSVPGTFTVYGGTPLHFDTSADQTIFRGSSTINTTVYAGSGSDTIYAGAGDVTIYAGAGNDNVIGGSGKSVFVLTGNSSDYSISWSGMTATVTDSVVGRDGVDTLTGVTSIKFADKTDTLASLATKATTATSTSSGTDSSTATKYNWTASDGSMGWASQVVAYDASGHIVGTSQYYSSGAVYSSKTVDDSGLTTTGKYALDGTLLQLVVVGSDGTVDVKDYSAAGTLNVETLTNADGSFTRYDYNVSGQVYTSEKQVYNAASVLVDYLKYNADGSLYSERKVLANGDIQQDQYVSGVLSQSVITSTTFVETKTYTNGTLVSDLIRNTDGTKILSNFGIIGKTYASDKMLFNTSGIVTDHLEYNPDGSLYAEIKLLANGATQQDLYSAGKITQTLITAKDGTTDTKTYANGTLVSDLIRNTDGTKILSNFGIIGKTYASDKMLFNTSGIVTDHLEYNADGSLYAEIKLLANGATQQDLYSAGKITQTLITAKDGTTDTKTYANGTLVSDLIRNTDGTKILSNFGIIGKTYASDKMLFNTSGIVTDHLEYNPDGSLYAEIKLLANGATQQDLYSAGKITQTLITAKDGTTDTKTYANGTLVSDLIRNTDGTKILSNFGIIGKTYASDKMLFNTSGVVTDHLEYNPDGSLYAEIKLLANGATQQDLYSAGKITQTLITAKDGTTDTKTYANGTLVSDLIRNTDGTKILSNFGIIGKTYASDKMLFDTSGVIVERSQYNVDGSLQSVMKTVNGQVTTNNYSSGVIVQQTVKKVDGSSQISSNASGLTLDSDGLATGARSLAIYNTSGVGTIAETVKADGSMSITALVHNLTLTSTSANEGFTSFGADTFVFDTQCGHDTISKFITGTSAAADTIVIKGAGVTSMQQLAMTQVGSDVVIGISAQSDITLSSTKLSSLRASNFSFA